MRLWRRDEDAQLNVVEAVIVGILVFTVLALTAIFRLPTTPATFQQSELERLAHDTLQALAAKPPLLDADCNEAPVCPFSSELERMLSIGLRYEGPTLSGSGEPRDVGPLTDYINQSLPSGTRYIVSYSNAVNDTRIQPLNLVPPSLDVSVGHLLISPNWTAYSANVADSVLVRIGEYTGLRTASVSTIRDPLNRNQDEWGHTLPSLLADAAGTRRVAGSALYGTYRVCPTTGACAYMTIVPPGVFDAGSHILNGDRDNSTSILTKGPFYTYAQFWDKNTNGAFNSPEPIYLHFGAGTSVATGDLRLNVTSACRGAGTADCPAGSFVKAGDTDVARPLTAFVPASQPKVRALNTVNNGILDEGEWVYIDADASGTVSVGDRRLSRVGVYKFGSIVATSDTDTGSALAPTPGSDFTGLTIAWADANANAALDSGEPVYLDFSGNGQSAGLESLDLHLSPKGSATARYPYDVKLVVWFGV